MLAWVPTGRTEDIHSHILGSCCSWKWEIKQKSSLKLSSLNSQIGNLST